MDPRLLTAAELGIRLEIAPNFYLVQGVKDVLIFNPYTLVVLHARRDGAAHHVAPVEIQLECGCSVIV